MKIIKTKILLILCLLITILISSCFRKTVTYKLDGNVLFKSKETNLYDWVYVEDYMRIFKDQWHHHDHYSDGILIDCILNIEWEQTVENNDTVMNGTVKSILRTGIFDKYNYLEETSDIIVSGILYSDSSVFKYPEYVYKIIDNKPQLFNSFAFVDFDKLKLKEEPIISDFDYHWWILDDASQLTYCESEIDKIIIPEQYTKNKTIPSYTFTNDMNVKEIEFLGDIGQINTNAFSESADKIIINGNINNIKPKGFVEGCEIYIKGNVENYTKYSFYHCDRIYSNNEIIQVIDNNEGSYSNLGLYIEFNNYYNLDKNVILSYLLYVYEKYSAKGKITISYSVDCDDQENSKLIDFNENYLPYYKEYEKFNENCYYWNKFTGLKVNEEMLKTFEIPIDEFKQKSGTIYIYLRFTKNETSNQLGQTSTEVTDAKSSIKYTVINNQIFLQGDNVIYKHYTISN